MQYEYESPTKLNLQFRLTIILLARLLLRVMCRAVDHHHHQLYYLYSTRTSTGILYKYSVLSTVLVLYVVRYICTTCITVRTSTRYSVLSTRTALLYLYSYVRTRLATRTQCTCTSTGTSTVLNTVRTVQVSYSTTAWCVGQVCVTV